MAPPIESLPTELFVEVTRHLRHGDLFQLMQVSKRCHQIIEPDLWTRIELHRPSHHEDYAYPHSSPDAGCEERPYIDSLDDHSNEFYLEECYRKTAKIFLGPFENLDADGSERLRHLASQVRWLCLSVDTYEDDYVKRNCWNALSSFVNLEYLQLDASWTEHNEIKPFDSSAPPLSKLHTVKMHGYVPREFVQYVCQQPSQLISLELGLLDEPIGGTLPYERRNPPRKELETPEDYEGMTEEELDALEDFDQEEVAPRPLCWTSERLSSHFTHLTRLWLLKPAEPAEPGREGFECYYSEPSDRRALEAWASVIRAARATLIHLTLEDRLSVHEIEAEGSSSDLYIELYCHGPSYHRFVGSVFPALIEEAEWPSLKQLHFYGIEVHAASHPSMLPGVNMRSKLRLRHPQAEVEMYLGRRMLFDANNGQVDSYGDGFGWQEDD